MWWISAAFAGGGLHLEVAPGSPPFSAIDVRCGAWRGRAELVDGVVELAALPEGACTVFFRGAPPTSVAVVAGDRKRCRFSDGVARCDEDVEPVSEPTHAHVVVTPNLRLAPDAPAYTSVHVSCRSPRFEADAPVIDRAAVVPGLPDAPCEATFSYPPPLKVALAGGPRTCDGDGRCAAGADRPASPVNVRVHGDAPVTAVEVVCPSGYHTRVDVLDGAATVPNVPLEGCKLYLKGVVSLPARVSGGEAMTCLAERNSLARCL